MAPTPTAPVDLPTTIEEFSEVSSNDRGAGSRTIESPSDLEQSASTTSSTQVVPSQTTIGGPAPAVVPTTTSGGISIDGNASATTEPGLAPTEPATRVTTTQPVAPEDTTAPPATVTPEPIVPQAIDASRLPADPTYAATNAAFGQLTNNNAAASLTVVTSGEVVYSNASGTTIDGATATSDSPMVVASVSKLIVAIGIARLESGGNLDIGGPVPWADLGLTPHPAWGNVTIRELLDHRAGLAKARSSWFTGEGSCANYIPYLLAAPPNTSRGEWVYSNGNYCLLGLLIEARTGLALDQALQQLVFDPIGVDGVHLTGGGLQPGDTNYGPGVDRLSRLGGAGTLVVSTDDIALLVAQPTVGDRRVLQPPGVFTDQYGFGHTGTVEGAMSCVWVLDGGATVLAATIAGDSYGSGGGVCDLMVPAVATDLGINQGRPDRTP